MEANALLVLNRLCRGAATVVSVAWHVDVDSVVPYSVSAGMKPAFPEPSFLIVRCLSLQGPLI